MGSEATQFKPGNNANPGGRPKGLAHAVRKAIEDRGGIAKILEIAFKIAETGKDKDRIAALTLLLDRGFGKPHQSITMDADIRNEVLDMLVMTPEQRARRMVELEERRRAMLEAPKVPGDEPDRG